jgi:radical SAM superfamily enzyme YgiQ (UPF0313 family)
MRNLVVLINPGHDDEVNPKVARSFGARSRKIQREDPPISIINLGGFIRDHGFDVVVLDTHVEGDYREKLRQIIKAEPLIIGFSVILGKFTKNAISLTKIVKALNKDIPIVWGGKIIHLAKNILLDSLDIDFLVIGDGEIPFLNLLKCLRDGKDYRDIPGIGFKDNGKAVLNMNINPVGNLDDIYISEDFGWDLVKQHINQRQVPYFINLYTSRGCKYNCSFCYLQDIKQYNAKKRFRRRSAENIIKEIDYLHKTFGINVVTFGDDDFFANVKEVAAVIEYLKNKQIYIEHIWTNILNLKPDAIELISGICQTVCYSIETVSSKLQKILRKPISVDKITEVNKKLRNVGINTVHNILFGIPTETDEETKANIDLLKKLKQINPHMRANTYILSPIPGTPIFEFGQKLAGKEIKWNLTDLANFHFRYMDQAALKFRPYLKPEDNTFFENVSELANELFKELNGELSPEQRTIIESDKRLRYIFGDFDNINRPNDKKRKYILDEVLEAIDTNQQLPQISVF